MSCPCSTTLSNVPCTCEGCGKHAAETIVSWLTVEPKVELSFCIRCRSVHKFAQEFMRRNQQLHVLVNNAGEFVPEDQVTEDGFEVCWLFASLRLSVTFQHANAINVQDASIRRMTPQICTANLSFPAVPLP